MEEVKIGEIVKERGLKYASSQILDSHAKSLKFEVNRRCRNLSSVDELINYSHINSDANCSFNNNIKDDFEEGKVPYIYCVSLGYNDGYIDPKLQNELYFSILDCINKGTISKNVRVVKITDHSHPVRLATPINKSCYSLAWFGEDLQESHCIPIVLGEYTGEVKYVGDDDISDESYSFQLTFKSSAFRYSGTVISSGNSQITDEILKSSISNTSVSQNTYFPESFEYNTTETSVPHLNKTTFFSKIYKQKINELLSTGGEIRRVGARLLLPNDNEYLLSADKSLNEMAFLNHYECILNNNFNFRINVQWHSVYVDGWPHIILTTIPGVGIKSGNELAADFGENWFSRIKRLSEFNIKKEIVFYRSNYNKLGVDASIGDIYSENHDSFEIERGSRANTETGINGMVSKYEICEICQNSVNSKILGIVNCKLSMGRNKDINPDKSYLLCNGCNRAFHYYCVNRPEFTDLSSNSLQWFCYQCVSLSMRIIPSLVSKVPFITHKIYKSILDFFKNEFLLQGVVSVVDDVIIRSNEEVSKDNSKLILFRPTEYYPENQRFFHEYQGLEGLSRLKPCYLCYSSFLNSNKLSVGVATICRIHRLHIAPDFDEFFNSVQYTYKMDMGNPIEKNMLKLSLVTEGDRQVSCSNSNDGTDALKLHIRKLSGPEYIIERARRVICSLRSSLYQSEKHRVELLYKLEKLRRIQDKYFKTISEGNGIIPILCIKLGDTVVNKEFSGKMYQGIATKYYPRERIFHIEYFDGDREDVEYEELISLLINDINSNRTNIRDLSIVAENEVSTDDCQNRIGAMYNELKNHTVNNFEVRDSNIENPVKNSIVKGSKNLFNNFDDMPSNSIIEKVKLIHSSIARQCKIRNNEDNHINISSFPEYEYIDEPRWNVITGSLKLNKNIIKYNIYVVLSRLSKFTITLTIISRICIGDVSLNKEIPITLLENDNEMGVSQEFSNIIELSSSEVLIWTNNRLVEFSPAEESVFCTDNSSHLDINKSLKKENTNIEGQSTFDNLKALSNLEIDHTFIKESWLQKANNIAQILQPYPNGIKWIDDIHSWKVVYYNETNQKDTMLFKVIPFNEENTVESLYLKACKFLSISQTNNKVIKIIKTNKKQKEKIEIIEPVYKFTFSEWGNTVEDFLARYNLSNPDRCVSSIGDFRAEINSLQPFPENVEWSDSSFSFIVKNSEQKSFKLEEYDFNIFNCYKAVLDYAAGESITELHKGKAGKYHLRVKNSTFLMNSDIKKNIKVLNKFIDPSKKKKKGRKKTLKEYRIQKNNLPKLILNDDSDVQLTDNNISKLTANTNNSECLGGIASDVAEGKIRKPRKSAFLEDTLELPMKRKKEVDSGRKTIIRAPPRPNDPLSRARIIEYSEKADELRPFPHGITWCYRSARFKVRYRRASDRCWTATSFTPTKYNSVKEAFEHAVKKLAAHIEDYRNSNEIPVIPREIP